VDAPASKVTAWPTLGIAGVQLKLAARPPPPPVLPSLMETVCESEAPEQPELLTEICFAPVLVQAIVTELPVPVIAPPAALQFQVAAGVQLLAEAENVRATFGWPVEGPLIETLGPGGGGGGGPPALTSISKCCGLVADPVPRLIFKTGLYFPGTV
jgi:hypothetical protein